MDYDIPESISQGSDRAQEAENRRIAEIADELSRLCRVHEAQLGNGKADVNGDPLGDTNRQRAVDEISLNKLNMPELFGHLPWGQHIEIFTRCKSLEEALY